MSEPDLKVEFCGSLCENPFFLAASPVSRFGEMIDRAFQMGWGGAITKSVSLAQDLPDRSLSPRFSGIRSGGSNLISQKKLTGMTNIDFRIDKSVQVTFEDYRAIKKKYPGKFLAVSIKAEYDRLQWHQLASMASATGADALELCLSCPDPSGDDSCCNKGSIGQNPQAVKEVIKWVKEVSDLPLMVKLSANVASIQAVGLAVQEAGADGISAINSIKSISGMNLQTLSPLPTIEGSSSSCGYSGSGIKPIAQYAVYELSKDNRINIPISAVGGITCTGDAIEFLALGAKTVQIATEVMHRGYGIIDDLKSGLYRFMSGHGFKNVADLIGIALPKLTASTKGLSRQQQLKSNIDNNKCIGCGKCYVACRDGAYQAVIFSTDRSIRVDSEKCVGCGLCKLICPVPDAIYFTAGEKRMEGLL